jgi:hypothetical protein
VAAAPDLAAIGTARAGSTTVNRSMFLTKADAATVAVEVGVGDEIAEGVAGGGCWGAEVKVVAWAIVTIEIDTTHPTSSLVARSTLHDSSLDPPAMELLSVGSVDKLIRVREGRGRDETSRERERERERERDMAEGMR